MKTTANAGLNETRYFRVCIWFIASTNERLKNLIITLRICSIIPMRGVNLWLMALCLLTSGHLAHYDFTQISREHDLVLGGYFIDWKSRDKGTECRKKCFRKANYIGGFCAAFGSFSSASVCKLIVIRDPMICGLFEGPFAVLAAWCGSGALVRFCDRCDTAYNKADIFQLAFNNNRLVSKLLDPLNSIVIKLEEVKDNYQEATLNFMNRLESTLAETTA